MSFNILKIFTKKNREQAEQTQRFVNPAKNFDNKDFVGIPDENLVGTVIDWLDTFDEYAVFGGLGKAPKVYQTILAVWAFDGEINNGGFIQFYTNHLSKENVDFYQLHIDAGLQKQAEIIKKANNVYEKNKAVFDTEAKTVEQFSARYSDKNYCDEFGKLDSEYFGGGFDMNKELLPYVKSNIGAFGNDVKLRA
jgi:hypothetical protein